MRTNITLFISVWLKIVAYHIVDQSVGFQQCVFKVCRCNHLTVDCVQSNDVFGDHFDEDLGRSFSMLPILIALLPCVTAAGGMEEADDGAESAYFMHLPNKSVRAISR